MFQSFQSGKTTEGINVDWSKDWSVVAGVERNLFGLIKVSKFIGWNNLKQLGKHQALSQIFWIKIGNAEFRFDAGLELSHQQLNTLCGKLYRGVFSMLLLEWALAATSG